MQCDHGTEKLAAAPQPGPRTVDEQLIGDRGAVPAIDAEFEMRVGFVSEEATQRPKPQDLPRWLREVREMRGRVFYEDGRRPFFRMPDLSFDDPDSADLNSYHVIASAEGTPCWVCANRPLLRINAGIYIVEHWSRKALLHSAHLEH